MRIVAVIQARMGSTRLPGKVLAEIDGKPMIRHVIDRARRIRGVDELVVAIPDLAEDDSLEAEIHAAGVGVVRGSAGDVLKRFADAARATEAGAVVRITADCPLLSPAVSSTVVADFARGGADYVSNTLERTFPRGLDTEVIDRGALLTAERDAADPAEREHVTPYVWAHPERFRLRSVRGEIDRHGLRWTVDTAEDLGFVRAVYAELGAGAFEATDVLALLDRRPELLELNAGIGQKPLA